MEANELLHSISVTAIYKAIELLCVCVLVKYLHC